MWIVEGSEDYGRGSSHTPLTFSALLSIAPLVVAVDVVVVAVVYVVDVARGQDHAETQHKPEEMPHRRAAEKSRSEHQKLSQDQRQEEQEQ